MATLPGAVLTFLVGSATALAVQLVVQFYIVPRVETRKRHEDRWERDVLELGELLTTVADKGAQEAQVEQALFRRFRQRESAPEQMARQARSTQEATWAFADIVNIRVDWLIGRVRSVSPAAGEIVRFQNAAMLYRGYALGVIGWHEDDDRPDTAFDEGWRKVHDARKALVREVKLLADLQHPPRGSGRAAEDWPGLLGGPNPLR